jgi:uncharacterized protein YjbI with pentapeptide repeats
MRGRLRRAYRAPGGGGGSVAEEFTCDVDKQYRSACKDLPKYSGSRYCVLHEPDEAKNKEDFEEAKKSKLDREDYDFRGTVFPEGTSVFQGFEFEANVSFEGAKFSGQWTSFSEAQFSGYHAFFLGAQFSAASTSFSEAQFGPTVAETALMKELNSQDLTTTDFKGAKFSGERTSFNGAKFRTANTSFQGAEFSAAYTSFADEEFGIKAKEVTFSKEVNFRDVTFRERAAFLGSQWNPIFDSRAWAQFHGSRIEKPELLTFFNNVLLHPGWFVNVDVRKVDFTDVKWYGMPGGPEGTLSEEINALEDRNVESPHTLLAQACRRLSANAEDNREYPLANGFHYWSMDAVRKGSWKYFKDLTLKGLLKKETWHDIGERFGLITTLYWLLNGYGVRAARAFLVLMGMWAIFTTFYVLVDPSEFKDFGQGIGYLWQTAVYSLLAMVRLNPEPTPGEPGLFQFLVGLEGILGPLQIALLALAVRRKVMR